MKAKVDNFSARPKNHKWPMGNCLRLLFVLFLISLAHSSCKSDLVVLGDVSSASKLTKYDFATIKTTALKENEPYSSAALICQKSKATEGLAKFHIESVSDTNINCTLSDANPPSLLCNPINKPGTRNWSSEINICCTLGQDKLCQSIELTVFDQNFDTSNATLNSVEAVDPPEIYKEGDLIRFKLSAPEILLVEGKPRIKLQFDQGSGFADYESGSGSQSLFFTHLVANGEESTKLDYSASDALQLNQGSIKIDDGSDADIRLPTLGSSGSLSGGDQRLKVDTTAPLPPFSVGFAYAFSGGSLISVSWGNGVDNNFKTHHLKLCAVDDCSTGCQSESLFASSPAGLSSAGGTYFACVKSEDKMGLTSAWVSSIDPIIVDTGAPQILKATSTLADGHYKVGDVIPISLQFSKIVLVQRPLDIKLELSTGPLISYVSGSGSDTLLFSYTIGSGENSSDLNYLNTSALKVGQGSIKDIVGNPASLTLPSLASTLSLAGQKDFVVDTIIPTAPSAITIPNGSLNPGVRVSVSYTAGSDANLKQHRSKGCYDSACSVSCSSESLSSQSPAELIITVPDHNYYACLQAEDLAGNLSPWVPSGSSTTVQGKAVRKIAASAIEAYNNCSILGDDSLRCWGLGDNGRLGIGNNELHTSPRETPVFFGTGKYPVEVGVGAEHSCARLNDGSIKCWGNNNRGQLGYGDTSIRSIPPTNPVNIGTGRRAKRLFVAPRATCVILDNDTAKCWGQNDYGILGLGDTLDRTSPDANPINFGAGRIPIDIKIGYVHSCAVFSNGEMSCWGINDYGVLGTGASGSTTVTSPPASALPIGGLAKQITLGERSSCVLLTNGNAKCWGRNLFGSLGYGDLTSRTVPPATAIDVGAGRTVKSIQSSRWNVCAILDDDSLKCWGHNEVGTVGAGAQLSQLSPLAVNLGAGRTVLDVQIMHYTTCALLDNYQQKCWGYADAGLLGRGDYRVQYTPSPALNLGGTVKKLATMNSGACAIMSDDTTKCWGRDYFGNIGGGQPTKAYGPDEAVTLDFAGPLASSIFMGRETTCAQLNNGNLTCWGANANGRLGMNGSTNLYSPNPSLSVPLVAGTINYVSSGWYHRCAIVAGNVYCWGDGGLGQLGMGDNINRGTPSSTAVALGGSLTAISVETGNQFSCAILSDFSVKCWGLNDSGQLGLGDNTNRNAPSTAVNLGPGRSAKQIAVGYAYTCAILDNDTVKCWGRNDAGQLGYGNGNDYYLPGGALNLGVGRTAKKLSARYRNTCAILDDDSLKCWGEGSRHGYYSGSGYNSPPLMPIYLGEGRKAKDVVTGDIQNCAVLDDDSVKCWGAADSMVMSTHGYGAQTTAPNFYVDFWAGARVLEVSGSSSGIFTSASGPLYITVEFSQPISVTPGNNMGLTLETGATDRVASYYSGSGTNRLTFRYDIVAGDSTLALQYLSVNALSAGDGSFLDTSGLPFPLTLPPLTSQFSLANQSLIHVNP